jgi:hypothetical protein
MSDSLLQFFWKNSFIPFSNSNPINFSVFFYFKWLNFFMSVPIKALQNVYGATLQHFINKHIVN